MVAAADIEGLADHVQRWTWLAGKMQQMMMEFMAKEATDGVVLGPDPLGLVETWSKMATAAMTDPSRLAQLQADYWRDAMTLWQAFATPGEVQPPQLPADKRFKGQAWSEMPAFDFLKSSYLLASQYVLQLVGGLDGLDDKERQKALFYTRQFIDALSPSNYLLTNPEVLKATVESKGENLLKGTQHLLDDLQRGRMTMTDEKAFEVGRNVAVTPGKVVFENRMFQLIQYAPSTANVYETPLLIFPPWINKFYILDLTPEKSFIRWAVAQGLTVFVVSWKNADESIADATTATYIEEGFLVAIDAVLKGLGVKSTHVIGYCVAGTTLAMTLALMAARDTADKVKTATFFTAQVDFSECGDLGVFVDEDHLKAVKELSESKGYLDGERPHLELRRQQLLARKGLFPLRPALLEFRFHERTSEVARRISGGSLPRQPHDRPRRHRHRRHAHRPAHGEDARLHSGRQRGSHRPGALLMEAHAQLLRPGPLRPRRQRPHRRRRQPARREQVPALDERHPPRALRRLRRHRHRTPRKLVAGLDQLADAAVRQTNPCPHPRQKHQRRQAQGDRGRTGEVCAGAGWVAHSTGAPS